MTAAGSESAGRLERRERLAILAVWTGLGLLESAKAWVELQAQGAPDALSTALAGNMPWWLLWAAFTPAVIALARRFPLHRPRLASVAAHIAASVVLAVLHHALAAALYYFTNTRGLELYVGGQLGPMTPARQFRGFLSAYFVVNVLTYWAALAGYLVLEFYKRYREGELRSARLEADMHEARLAALRMELNPHFLFNTLNAIAGLVRRTRNDEAVRMIARLGELLRATLEDADDREVPLEKELELLRIYLEIESIRFGDRLSVSMEVSPEAELALVPPLILQPLVENAVRHGVALHEGPARIDIRATVEGERLEIVVANSGGDGATPEADTRRRGIGLENTRERLRHLYGERASLRLEPLPDGGAQALLSAPLRSSGATPGPAAPARGRS